MNNLRIVVADDEGLIAMDVAEILEEAGYEVVAVAKDGVEAYEAGRNYQPDLFVLDIKMPRMDGIQTARRIAADGMGPVVLLTAYNEDDLVDKASESGVYAYLLKPVDEFALLTAIKMAFSRYRSLAQTEVQRDKAIDALAQRKIIEKAKGLLVERYGITEEEAFSRLRGLAMKKEMRLEKLAGQVIRQIENDKRIKCQK